MGGGCPNSPNQNQNQRGNQQMTFTNTDSVRHEINKKVDDQFNYEVWNQVDDQVFLVYPIRYKIIKEINK